MRSRQLDRTTMHSMNSSRLNTAAGGFSMVAVEEIVAVPSRHGVVAVRRVKMTRLDEGSSQPGPRAQQPRRSNQLQSRPERAEVASEPQTGGPSRHGKRVALRSVGDVVRDEAGRFYEVRGDKLYALGELVSDAHGRIFEVELTSDQLKPNERKDEATNRAATEAANKAKTEHSSRAKEYAAEGSANQTSQPKNNGGPTQPAAASRPTNTQPGQRNIRSDQSRSAETRPVSARGPQRTHPQMHRERDGKMALRAEIPLEYRNPLQFRYSREEVIYDMKAALGTLRPEAGALMRWFLIYPLRLLKAIVIATVSRRRMKKWRAMLEHKSLDERLWAVTPPRGFSYQQSVRLLIADTLSRAGYDPRVMLLEWEIFWRRKGWQ